MSTDTERPDTRFDWPSLVQEALRFERQAKLPAQMALMDRNMPVALWGTVLTGWVCAGSLGLLVGDPWAPVWAVWVSLLSLLGLWMRRHHAARLDERRTALHYARTMRAAGVLISATGKRGHVLKIRPPLVFSRENVAFFLERLERVLKTG